MTSAIAFLVNHIPILQFLHRPWIALHHNECIATQQWPHRTAPHGTALHDLIYVLQEGVRHYIGKLNHIDRLVLSRQERVDFDVLADMLQTFNDSSKWTEWEFSPLDRIMF